MIQMNHTNLDRKKHFEENDLSDMRIMDAKYQGQSPTPLKHSREAQVLSEEWLMLSMQVQPQKEDPNV